MGYWTYYLALSLLAYGLRYPWLMAGLLVLWLGRRFIPDPVLWLRTAGTITRLEARVSANPADVTARRDLATLYLTRLRPGRALALLEEAERRFPDDAELQYLKGLALLRTRRANDAIEPLVRAVTLDPRVRFGEPYWAAAEALIACGRLEDAEDALERFVESNTSSMKGLVRLALVRRRRGDGQGAERALTEAFATWRQLPGYRKRGQRGAWLRGMLARMGW